MLCSSIFSKFIMDKKLHASKCKQFYQFPKDISLCLTNRETDIQNGVARPKTENVQKICPRCQKLISLSSRKTRSLCKFILSLS